MEQPSQPVILFYSYAHEDENLRQKLEKHLSSLRHEGLISGWYDGLVVPGTSWAQDIYEHLNRAFVILLLISPDFLASDHQYTIVQRALERHSRGEAYVLPILLRPCDWRSSPFAHLQCLPHNQRPVTLWSNEDEGFLNIVQGIRQVIERVNHSHHSGLGYENALTYKGHKHFVLTVAWSPDSKYLASAGADETVRLWNATTLETIQTYSNHFGWFYPAFNPRPYIYIVAWSPDGMSIASAGTGTKMHVWNAQTGDTQYIYSHSNPFLQFASIHTLAWSPDGTRIASICNSDLANIHQKVVHVWNRSNGQGLLRYPMPTLFSNGSLTEVSALSWSPNGQYIASTSGDKNIHIWSAVTGKRFAVCSIHAKLVLTIAWSPNSEQIVFANAAGSKSSAIVWSMLRKEVVVTYRGHTSDVRTVTWSPDGKYIASGGQDDTVQIWNAVTGECTEIFRHHSSFVASVAWSPDGTRLASASHDKTVHVWQVR